MGYGEKGRQVAQLDPEALPDGSRFKHSADTITQALYELAAAGGNCNKAAAALEAAVGIRVSPHTLREWKRGPFRNRYHELRQTHQRQLEERIAQDSVDIALRASEIEKAALKQTAAQLSSASGVEASQILRNVSQAKGLNLDKAKQLREGPQGNVGERSLTQIARALERLGLATIEGEAEEIVEAEVVQ